MSELLRGDSMYFDEISSSSITNENNLIEGEVPMDLCSYISNYHGYIYYQRLFFIASRCPSLRATALRLAHDYIKKSTLDTAAYNRIFLMLAEQAASVTPDSNFFTESTSQSINDPRLLAKNQFSDTISVCGTGEALSIGAPISDAASAVLKNVMLGKNEANLVYDSKWEESTRLEGIILLEQLDTELKNYKANSIKESIRRGSDNLGDLYVRLGQLNNASKCYTRSRDYCTSQQQELVMCLNVIKVAIFQRAWPHVGAHVQRANNLSELRDSATSLNTNSIALSSQRTRLVTASRTGGTRTGGTAISSDSITDTSGRGAVDSSGRMVPWQMSDASGTTSIPIAGGQSHREAMGQARTYLAIATGLVELAARNYRLAAMNFLQISYDHCESPTSGTVTTSDLAYYITLCSLASFDRSELASLVLGNPNLRLLLESEPVCRDILQSFHQANYSICLGHLNKLKNFLLLDLFLADHVPLLCHEIRCRALCQYFSPYSSADLNSIAVAFDTNVTNLENELATLIQDGHIKARIDSHKQLLRVLDVDQRCLTFARTLRLADEYRKHVHSMILRMALARQKLIVKSAATDPETAIHLPL